MYGKTGEKHPCHLSNLGNTHALGHKHSPETRKVLSDKARLREQRKREERLKNERNQQTVN